MNGFLGIITLVIVYIDAGIVLAAFVARASWLTSWEDVIAPNVSEVTDHFLEE